MKYQHGTAFARDFKRLTKRHQDQFLKVLFESFIPAAEKHASGKPSWPKSLRVESVQGLKGVFELSWSMNAPDGRATWEWVEIDGKPAIRWRRIGDHSIFKDP